MQLILQVNVTYHHTSVTLYIYYTHTQTQWNIQNAAANALCQHQGIRARVSRIFRLNFGQVRLSRTFYLTLTRARI